jgi:hypothetical protein
MSCARVSYTLRFPASLRKPALRKNRTKRSDVLKPEVARIIARILGTAGILLILAGPAFHLLASQPALFAGIACFVVSGTIMGILRRGGADKEEK